MFRHTRAMRFGHISRQTKSVTFNSATQPIDGEAPPFPPLGRKGRGHAAAD